MEYAAEAGLFIYNPMWALFIIVLSGWIVWIWPELGVAVFCVIPHVLRYTEIQAGFLGYHMSLDYPLMVILLVRLWFIYSRQYKYDKQVFRDPMVVSSLFLVGLQAAHPVLTRGWDARTMLLQQVLENYVICFLGVLVLSGDKRRLSRFLACAFGILTILQIAFASAALPAAVGEQKMISRFYQIYNIQLWDSRSVFALLVGLGYWLIPSNNRLIRAFLPVTLITSLFLLILGRTRGYWISAIMVGGFVLIASGQLTKRLVVTVIIGGVLLLVSIAFPQQFGNVQTVAFEAFEVRYFATLGEDPLNSRLDLWENAWYHFKRSPIWGVGYYQAATERVLPGGTVTRVTVHNDLLRVLAEQGLIGFFILLAFLFRTAVIFRENLRSPAESPDIRRCQLVGMGVFLIYLMVLQISYWPAALALASSQYKGLFTET